MKNYVKILFAILSITFVACNSSKTAVEKTSEAKKEITTTSNETANSLLWKISGNGLEKPSYLFGTIHLTCNYELKDKVKKALDETTRLTLEVDMDDPMMQAKAMQNMMMKDGQSIDKLLTEEEYKKLEKFIKEQTGMPLAMMKTMKPFALSSMLLMKFIDCPKPESYEAEIMKIVKADNEEVLGLETIESQLQIFDKIPYKEQLDELLKMADEGVEKGKEEFSLMNEMYAREDIKGLLSIMDDQEAMETKYAELLLDNRNKNWIPVIDKMAHEEPTFFGVGAMHLPGKVGVINLLREAGFTVEPVLN